MQKYPESIQTYHKALELDSLTPSLAGLIHFNLACIHARLDEKENILENLRKAISFDANWKEKAQTDEDFKDLRSDSEFQKLIY